MNRASWTLALDYYNLLNVFRRYLPKLCGVNQRLYASGFVTPDRLLKGNHKGMNVLSGPYPLCSKQRTALIVVECCMQKTFVNSVLWLYHKSTKEHECAAPYFGTGHWEISSSSSWTHNHSVLRPVCTQHWTLTRQQEAWWVSPNSTCVYSFDADLHFCTVFNIKAGPLQLEVILVSFGRIRSSVFFNLFVWKVLEKYE